MFNGARTMLDQIIGIRFHTEDKLLLQKVCEARGEDLSDFIRRAVRKELASLSYYSSDVKKALGVKEVHSP